jgi:hypothetical protein
MTEVPLPDHPTIRIALGFTDGGVYKMGTRSFYRNQGPTPVAADLALVASNAAAEWASVMAPFFTSNIALTDVSVLDITTNTGAEGEWTGSHVGTNANASVPQQLAAICNFKIARHYRGGKPKCYLPAGSTADTHDGGHWNSTFVANFGAACNTFYSAQTGLPTDTFQNAGHVNVSYRHLFDNVDDASGRAHAKPRYRATAITDLITGYVVSNTFGSQRRRRKSLSY